MKIDLRKTLLAGTALVAVGAFSTSAQAANEISVDENQSNDGVYEVDVDSPLAWTTGHTDARDIAVNDDATIVMDAGETIGNADSTVDGIVFVSNAKTLTFTDGDDDGGDVGVTVTDGISLGTGITAANITVTGDDDANGADTFTFDVNGAVDLGTGVLTLTADQDTAGNDVTFGLSGNLTAGSVSLDAGSSAAILLFDGAAATTVAADIAGAAAGEGDLVISTTTGTIEFTGGIGQANTVDTVTIGSGGATTVQFSSNVATNGLIIGNGGAHTDTAIFNNGTASQTIAGAITANAAGTANIDIIGTNTTTFSGAVGAGGNVDSISLDSAGTAVFSSTVDASAFTVAASGATATLNGDVGGNAATAISFTSAGTVTLGDDVALTGTVDNGTGGDGVGTLNLGDVTGGGNNTISGNVGATNSLLAVTFTSSGIGVFSGSLNAETITLASGSTLRMSGTGALTGDVVGAAGVQTVDIVSSGNIGGTGDSLDLGAGNDALTIGNVATDIAFADGIDGGAGTDAITKSGAATATISAAISGFEDINVNAGGLTLTGAVNDAPEVTFGGTGVLTINSTESITFSSVTGDGNDNDIVLNGGSTLTVTNTVDLGAGADDVTVTNGTIAAATTIGTGADIDNVTLTAGTIAGTINTEAGADNVTVTAGTMSGTIATGAGTDVIDINGGTISGTINSGAENDTVTIAGATISGTLNGGDGADTVTVDGATSLTGTLTSITSIELDSTLTISGTPTLGTTNFTDADNNGTLVFGAAAADSVTVGGSVENADVDILFGTVTTTSGAAWGGGTALDSLDIAEGATFDVNSDVTLTGADIDLEGTLNIGAGKTVAARTVTATTDGTLTFELSQSGATLSGGLLTVDATGNAINFSSAGIDTTFNFVQASGSEALRDAGTFVVVDGTNDTFTFDAASVTGGTRLLSFALAADGNNDLEVTVTVNSLTNATSFKNRNVGTRLQSDTTLAASTDAGVSAIREAMFNATSDAQLAGILEQAAPTVSGGEVLGAMNVSNQTTNITTTRTAALRNGEAVSGMAAGELSKGLQVWGQAFGTSADQGERDGISGYDLTTFGFATGIDTQNLIENGTLGVALSYADTEVDSDAATNIDVDSYQFSIYGDYAIDDRTFVNGLLAYTLHENETAITSAGGTRNGDFDANQYTVFVEVGRDYEGGENLTLTPSVLAHWSHYDADSYTETGAAAQRVDSDALNVFEIGVGVDAAWMYSNADGSYVQPKLSAGYRYDIADEQIETNATFSAGGASFKTEGFDPQQHTVDLGASVTYYTTDNWELTADYNFELKGDYTGHNGTLRAAYKF